MQTKIVSPVISSWFDSSTNIYSILVISVTAITFWLYYLKLVPQYNPEGSIRQFRMIICLTKMLFWTTSQSNSAQPSHVVNFLSHDHTTHAETGKIFPIFIYILILDCYWQSFARTTDIFTFDFSNYCSSTTIKSCRFWQIFGCAMFSTTKTYFNSLFYSPLKTKK